MAEVYISLDDDDRRFIKRTISQCINNMLPQILEEITPIVLEKSKDVIKNSIKRKINSDIEYDVALAEGLLITEQNPRLWNGLLDQREDMYYNLTRAECLLSLYMEGLHETPIYVPWKFRQDDKHVKSLEDLNVVHKRNVQRLQTEITILEIKIDDFREELNSIDKAILHKLSDVTSNKIIINALTIDIKKKINKDTSRINREWAINVRMTREAFKEDQSKYQERKKDLFYPIIVQCPIIEFKNQTRVPIQAAH